MAAHGEKIDDPPVPWMHGLAGVTGGAIGMTIFYPLDLLRTRLHTQDGTQQMKLRGFKAIFQQEGMRGLYKGCPLAVCSHSVGWGLYLLLFRSAQTRISHYRGRDSAYGDFLGACVAATGTSVAVTPLNLMKTRTQLHDVAGQKPKGMFRGMRRVIQLEGWRSLFRGLGPQVLLSAHTTIQVALYECTKRKLWTTEDPPMLGVAFSSAFSKAIAAIICNPLEVCRTRLQDERNCGTFSKNYSGLTRALGTIWRTEGFRGLYRGASVNMLRVIPTTVAAFIFYEKIVSGMNCLRKEKSWKKSARRAVVSTPAAVEPELQMA